MKQISISKLKQMSGDDIKDSGCFTIVKDDEQIAIVIVGAVQEMKSRLHTLASQIDLARGK